MSKRPPSWRQPAFEYACSKGHAIASIHLLDRCPAMTHGQPCRGTLRRIGQGSRSKGDERRTP